MKFDNKRIRNKSMVGLVRPVSTCRHSGVIIKKKKKKKKKKKIKLI